MSGAAAGTLAIMVEATAEALGEPGHGNVLKLLNNLVALTNQAVLCQVMALADPLGVSRQTVGDVLGKSSGASVILRRKPPALAARDYRGGFFVELALKDLGLALDMAEAPGHDWSWSRRRPGSTTRRSRKVSGSSTAPACFASSSPTSAADRRRRGLQRGVGAH